MAIIRNRPPKRSITPDRSASTVELIDLAKQRSIKTIPLDVAGLARALGLRIRREALPDDVSGHLTPTDDGWVITVNSLHHPKRQRFTIAHEIGHYMLHRDENAEFIDKTLFRSAEWSPMEKEANSYAAELLMPEAEFRAFARDQSSKVEAIAEYFQVSALAVRVRAKQLGFKGHGL